AIALITLYKRSGGFWNCQKMRKKPPEETSPICSTTASQLAKNPAPIAHRYMNGSTSHAPSRRVAHRKVIAGMPITSSASISSEIRIPAWRSASPKNLNTRSPKISRNTCATNLTISPNASTQPFGVIISSCISAGVALLRDRGDLGMRGQQRLRERVVEREDPVKRDHHRLIHRTHHPLRPTRSGHPLITTHDRDDRPEHRRLQHRHPPTRPPTVIENLHPT